MRASALGLLLADHLGTETGEIAVLNDVASSGVGDAPGLAEVALSTGTVARRERLHRPLIQPSR